jgi:hypothetical protein
MCLINQYAMRTYSGVEVELHTFLTSALDGSEWSVSCPSCFTPRIRALVTHWIGGWEGLRTWGGRARRKNSFFDTAGN